MIKTTAAVMVGGALAAAMTATPALATDDNRRCNAPADAKWISLEEAAKTARGLGYGDIREIEKDDGCWEVEARNAKGEEVELYLHPVSGEVVKIERD